jgi:hypothetical protein
MGEPWENQGKTNIYEKNMGKPITCLLNIYEIPY